MIVYTVSIGAVDGVTEYMIKTPDKSDAINFLMKHDHEGSSIGLMAENTDTGNEVGDRLFNEAVYTFLNLEG